MSLTRVVDHVEDGKNGFLASRKYEVQSSYGMANHQFMIPGKMLLCHKLIRHLLFWWWTLYPSKLHREHLHPMYQPKSKNQRQPRSLVKSRKNIAPLCSPTFDTYISCLSVGVNISRHLKHHSLSPIPLILYDHHFIMSESINGSNDKPVHWTQNSRYSCIQFVVSKTTCSSCI